MQQLKENPRYFEFRGTPTVIVGSGEHYGSLLNADFDYATYFEQLARLGLNHTRVFSGTYRERPGHFGIESNNLAPRQGRFVSPWLEVEPDRFDLYRPNPGYLPRLRDVLDRAAAAGVIVELVLFCFWYGDDHWKASPMHPERNTAGIGPEDRERVFTLSGNDLLPVQEELVRTVVEAVNEYDNVYFEICNEPYSRHDGTAYLDWQHYMVELIRRTEAQLSNRHEIAVNYQNRAYAIPEVHPEVSILNFHYALPEAVFANAHFGRPISDDETGFSGQLAAPYRKEAWRFFFAGGALFSHLDYGFTCENPDGTGNVSGRTPGYGGDDLRRQLAFLRQFLEESEVWRLRSANELFARISGELEGLALSNHDGFSLFYLPDNAPGQTVSLRLEPGSHRVEWVNPVGCWVTHEETIEVRSNFHRLETPLWEGELVFRVARLG